METVLIYCKDCIQSNEIEVGGKLVCGCCGSRNVQTVQPVRKQYNLKDESCCMKFTTVGRVIKSFGWLD